MLSGKPTPTTSKSSMTSPPFSHGTYSSNPFNLLTMRQPVSGNLSKTATKPSTPLQLTPHLWPKASNRASCIRFLSPGLPYMWTSPVSHTGVIWHTDCLGHVNITIYLFPNITCRPSNASAEALTRSSINTDNILYFIYLIGQPPLLDRITYFRVFTENTSFTSLSSKESAGSHWSDLSWYEIWSEEVKYRWYSLLSATYSCYVHDL